MSFVLHRLHSLLNTEIISHAGYALLLRASGIGMAFIAHGLIAKALGASEYGIYSLAITAVSLLSVASIQGYDLSAQKFIPSYQTESQPSSTKGFVSFSYRKVLSAALIASVVLVLSGVLASRFQPDLGLLLQLAVLLLIATTMMQYYSAILRAYRKVLCALIPVDLLRPFLLVMAGIYFLALPQVATSLNAMILTIASAAISMMVAIFLFHRATSGGKAVYIANNEDKEEWNRVSRPLYLAALLGLMQTQIDILLVGIFRPGEEVGIYSLASRIAALVWLGGYAVSSVSGAIMSEILSKPDSSRKLQNLFRSIAFGQILYTVPAAIILIFVGVDLLGYFGSDYSKGFAPLVILTAAFSVASLSGPVGILMSVSGYQYQGMVVTAITVCLQIILSLMFIPSYGLVGAASVTACCFVGRVLVMLFIVRIKLGIDCSVFCLLKNDT